MGASSLFLSLGRWCALVSRSREGGGMGLVWIGRMYSFGYESQSTYPTSFCPCCAFARDLALFCNGNGAGNRRRKPYHICNSNCWEQEQ
jgi:hypothetical protein